MTEEHKERIYEGVRRMVMRDEPRADVFHRMEVNGIPPEEAHQMHEKARAERMSAIRHAALKQTGLGLAGMLSAFGLVMGWFSVYEIIPDTILALCALTAAFGTWHFSKNLFYLLFAHNKKGSLEDAD
jgi:hypothetical protein